MDESEYNEYLYNKMKNISASNNSNTNTKDNNKRKKRLSRYRGFGSKRGLNLRVKLKRFWVRARVSRWLKLKLRCLSRALQSLLFNISTITSTRNRRTSNSTNNKSTHHCYNHSQYSFGRSNSFYAEAIADCLEFIKLSSSNHYHHHRHDQQQSHESLLQ